MPWWLTFALLALTVVFWSQAASQRDDVIALFLKLLAVVALMVVVLGGRPLALELALLVLAFRLPGAARFDSRDGS
jgi:hypothetical protein